MVHLAIYALLVLALVVLSLVLGLPFIFAKYLGPDERRMVLQMLRQLWARMMGAGAGGEGLALAVL